MYILAHFDWFGSIEELEKVALKLKEMFDGSKDVKFLGRFGPLNRKFHWTHFYMAKDFVTWATEYENADWSWFNYDRRVHGHEILEYYVDA
jgi:hypothetical protein